MIQEATTRAIIAQAADLFPVRLSELVTALGDGSLVGTHVTGPSMIEAPDRFEDNDDPASATDLGLVSGRRIEMGLNHETGDSDWYRFDLAGTGQGADGIEIAFDQDAGDLALTLYIREGTVAVRRSNTTTDNEFISFGGLPAGTYFAEVSGAGNPAYDLILEAGPNILPDRFEDNDSIEAATPLGLITEERIEPDLTAETGDQDWYRFELGEGAGEGGEVRVDYSADGDGLILVLRDEMGTRLDRSETGEGSETVSLDGRAPGVYFAQVRAQGDGVSPDYTLSISPSPASSAVLIAGQDFNALTAAPITTDQIPTAGRLTNGGATNDGGPGLDFFTQWTATGLAGPATGNGDTEDAIGVAAFGGANAPDVSPAGIPIALGVEQNFIFNDSDGFADLRFEPIDLSSYTGRTLEFSFWVAPDATYEEFGEFADKLEVYLGTPLAPLGALIFEQLGNDLTDLRSPDDGTANWNTVSLDLEPFLGTDGVPEDGLQIMVATRTTADDESIFIDDVAVTGVPLESATAGTSTDPSAAPGAAPEVDVLDIPAAIDLMDSLNEFWFRDDWL